MPDELPTSTAQPTYVAVRLRSTHQYLFPDPITLIFTSPNLLTTGTSLYGLLKPTHPPSHSSICRDVHIMAKPQRQRQGVMRAPRVCKLPNNGVGIYTDAM
ncbi:hypothetical protein WAI453_003722 [Rhynchosporium graminicola]